MNAREAGGLVVPILALLAGAYALGARSVGGTPGWVLWEKTMKDGGPAARWTTEWEPLDGFDRLSSCHQSGQEIVEGARAFMSSEGRTLVAVRPDGRSAVYSMTENGAERRVDYRLVCFPGQVDPRSSSP
jgi:hypothetical protein